MLSSRHDNVAVDVAMDVLSTGLSAEAQGSQTCQELIHKFAWAAGDEVDGPVAVKRNVGDTKIL